MLLRVMVFGLAALFLILIISQVVYPLVTNTRFFPLFTKPRELEGKNPQGSGSSKRTKNRVSNWR